MSSERMVKHYEREERKMLQEIEERKARGLSHEGADKALVAIRFLLFRARMDLANSSDQGELL